MHRESEIASRHPYRPRNKTLGEIYHDPFTFAGYPDLLAVCVVADGEAETGPLATAWHSNKFLNPATDGAVLPILHLNGYTIANPTILARIGHEELKSLRIGYGYKPYFVEGDDPTKMHALMAEALDPVIAEIKAIQDKARSGNDVERP